MVDLAGILALGKAPEGLAEDLFATLVDFMVSGALGIVFAFLVPYIGRRYLWFKGLFLLGAFWYVYYPVITVGMLGGPPINVQTHLINATIAGLFGIVLAHAYFLLHLDIHVKNNNTKGEGHNKLASNEFAEEIAAPIAEPPFVPLADGPPAAPINLTATPDRWSNEPDFEIAWSSPEHHTGIRGAYYKLSTPPTDHTDGIYVTANPFTVTAAEAEQHLYVWLQDNDGRTAYQNAAFITLKYDPVGPTWPRHKGLKVTKVTPHSVTLQWPPVTDNTKDIKYRPLVNKIAVGKTANTTFTVPKLEPGTIYTFSVLAEDEAGNTTEIPRPKKIRTRKRG